MDTRSPTFTGSKVSRTLPASICVTSRIDEISLRRVSPFSMIVRT